MSHFSTSLPDAEPPYGEQPLPSDDDPTLDLGMPEQDGLTLFNAQTDVAAFDASAQDEPVYQAEEADETIDLSADQAGEADETIDVYAAEQIDEADETVDLNSAPEALLVGCELQQGKYQVLALRSSTLAGSPLLGASYTADRKSVV